MPTLAEINDYKVTIYGNRGDLRGLPNVNVWKKGAEVEFLIGYGEQPRLLLRRSYGFSAQELGEVEQIILRFARELRKTWCDGFA
jgi:hypothetical protein